MPFCPIEALQVQKELVQHKQLNEIRDLFECILIWQTYVEFKGGVACLQLIQIAIYFEEAYMWKAFYQPP